MNLMELFVKIGVDDQASSKVGSITDKIGGGLKTAANIGVKAIKAASGAIVSLTGLAIKNYSEYEQLAGGAGKIFDEMNPQTILSDAQDAYLSMGLSANQYLAVINDVGAAFASTMGDEKGYEAAKTGLQAISDYASGTGKNVDLLSEKFMMITRSTSSYQSIADQFSGILPATSKDFLAQAQAAGILSDSYTELTQVPIDEYQQAVSEMLKQGVADLGLANNTVLESETTISGSFAAMKAAADNFLVALVDDNADVGESFGVLASSVGSFVDNIVPKIWDFIGALGPVGPLLAGITVALGAFKVAISISEIVGAATVAFDAYRKANEGATVAQWLMNAAMNANPIVLVVTLIAGLVAALVTLWHTNDNFRDALIKAWETIKSAATRIFSAVANFFKKTIPNAFNSVVNWFKNIGKKFAGIGRNIVAGIKSGIKGAWNNLVSWFKGLFGNLIGIAKKILGIKSPSRVFKKIGGFTAEGFGIGFEDEFAHVKDDMKKALTFEEASIGINASIKRIGAGQGAFGSNAGGVSIVQNIYSQAKTAADLMQEALYQQKRAVYMGV